MSHNRKVEATLAEVRQAALNLLARREHSVLELHHKLVQRDFAPNLVDTLLAQLGAEDLVNDARYAEIYAHTRVDKGYGPLRINRELRERGVSENVIVAVLAGLEDFWMKKLAQVQRKRFGEKLPADAIEQNQQARFLRHRGFTLEQIKRLFRGE